MEEHIKNVDERSKPGILSDWWSLISMHPKKLLFILILISSSTYGLLGCGSVNENFLYSSKEYLKPILKQYEEMLKDEHNPMFYNREQISKDEYGKPNFDHPLSPTLKENTIKVRMRNVSNLRELYSKEEARVKGEE